MASADTIRRSFNAFSPKINRSSFDALMSVRQIVHYTDFTPDSAKYHVYDFCHFIPFGFTYESYVPEQAILPMLHCRQLPDVPLQLLANLVVKETDIHKIKTYLKQGRLVSGNCLDSVVAERRRVTCSKFQGNTRGFEADINLEHSNYVFFSVPSDPGFTASVDGKPVEILTVNLGLSAVLVPQGSHHIAFSFFPRGLKTGLAISLLMLVVLFLLSFYEYRIIHRCSLL